ncbi:hypothetical protein A1OO_14950 [Enterovibrio norvegicus FF-33]|uniref:DUF4156 domain-containing protein n=1 Tax=Enterovibrio TaxID=188143 RepID=UPI00031196A4|nr:DUF4156 domain-containing protein [Enterovibrio norvegicus]OEE67056.1 hypothetical protein A1OO_14950 [Enterovibrio norvegicus FF-33]OEE79467.1 hypothetical protein A1OQ_04875 [Enterovibrio norvegicus FF-162]
MKNISLCAAWVSAALLSGCVTFPTQESEQVQVIWDDINAIQGCEHKGTVIGSEGHFYDYWLHADKDMVWGTLNQMRMKAAEKGGNVLYLYQPFGFSSSVTMFGNAYACDVDASLAAAADATEKAATETTAITVDVADTVEVIDAN